MKNISILGSTGSIGTQALDVARAHNINIQALAASTNVKLLEQQAREFNPKVVCIYNVDKYLDLKQRLSDTAIKVICGMDGLCEIALMDNVDIMLNSVVGMVGLLPTIKALNKKTTLALANKETLVVGGEIVTKIAKDKNIKILPVDSEHSAIYQCLQGNKKEQLNKIILTASGGPFFGKTKDDLQHISVKDALNHPNWSMGNKITIDSATLMNKGLEFIEAMWLFDLKPDQIEIVVHRESVVHSAVEYKDYSVIAQMGVPDMKIPIQYALLYPDRVSCPTKRLSLTDYGTLSFKKPDFETFDCLTSCIEAIKLGGTSAAVVNGANEEAVRLFLDGKISFLKIGELVKKAIMTIKRKDIESVADIFEADKSAREFVLSNI